MSLPAAFGLPSWFFWTLALGAVCYTVASVILEPFGARLQRRPRRLSLTIAAFAVSWAAAAFASQTIHDVFWLPTAWMTLMFLTALTLILAPARNRQAVSDRQQSQPA
jgi:MFS family permease